MSSSPLLPLYAANSAAAPTTVVELVSGPADAAASDYGTLTLSLRRRRSRHSPLRRSFDAYMGSLDRHPLRTKMLTVATILTASAVLSSLLKDPHLTHLNFRFLLSLFIIGVTIGSVPYHFLYDCLERNFPTADKRNVFVHVAVDQFLALPLYYVLYFLARDLLMGQFEPHAFCTLLAAQLWPVLKMCWMIYCTSQAINFALVPPRLRLIFNTIVALVVNTLMTYFFLTPSSSSSSSDATAHLALVHLLLPPVAL